MATAYLLHGFAGAGKTTYAKELEKTTGGIRFTADEWIATLFGIAPPSEQMANIEDSVKSIMWYYAKALLARNVNVILDFGFWKRAERDFARQQVESWGHDCHLVLIDAPIEEIRTRIQRRNASLTPDTDGKGLDYLWIDDEALEMFRARFEPLESDEKYTLKENV